MVDLTEFRHRPELEELKRTDPREYFKQERIEIGRQMYSDMLRGKGFDIENESMRARIKQASLLAEEQDQLHLKLGEDMRLPPDQRGNLQAAGKLLDARFALLLMPGEQSDQLNEQIQRAMELLGLSQAVKEYLAKK